jgi:hypothetical protein
LIRRPIKDRLGHKRSKSIRNRDKKLNRHREVPVQSSKDRSKLNHLTIQSAGREWEVKQFPDRTKTALAVSLRRSNRWLTDKKFPQTSCELPFIDHVGRFTGYGVYRVNWSPSAYIATVCATIWRRLKFFILRKTTIYEFRKRQHLYMRCCAYYALSKNDYFWDRLLVLSRKKQGWRTISKLLHQFSLKLDDYKWFVYSGVCLQTYWLTFRAVRPRDKSALYLRSFPTRERKFSSLDDRNMFFYNAIWDTFCKVSQCGL